LVLQAGAGGHLPQAVRLAQQPVPHGGGQRLVRALFDEEPGHVVLYDLRNSAGGEGDDGHARGECFQDHAGRGVDGRGGNHQQVQGGEDAIDVLLPAGEFDGQVLGERFQLGAVAQCGRARK
jgi:hypothetical protein